MNNATIITNFNGDNSNIAKSKTNHRQIRTNITYGILKSKLMIKKPIQLKNYTFFYSLLFIFRNIRSFIYINSVVIQHL